MKRIVSKILFALMILCTINGFSIEKVSAVEKLDVKIDVGYNNNYKIGFSTPVNVTIKNNYKDINGEVEIRVPSTPGKYMSYVKPISLQKDAEKIITINIPVSMNRTKHVLNIYDGKEKVFEDSITTVAANNVTTFIGILSDDFDSLSYINKVPAAAGVSLVTKTIKLDEKNFPEDIFTLNAFDILVINDYDTSKFSKLQYDILKQWINGGGTLLVGTGSKYNKTLSVFKDDFIAGTQGTIKDIATSKIYELATNGDSKNEVKVDTLSLSVKDSKVLMEDKEVKMVQSLKKGKGTVGILAFDLGQAPFANWNNNTAFVEKLIGIVNPEMTMTNYKNNIDYYQNNAYMIRNAMNQFSEMARAKTSSFYLILFIYVLVVAPLSYFILKKLDKRELMWITVPVVAIVFGIMVYISGSGTRLSEITTNMISFLNIDEKGNASTTTYAGVFNTNKMKVNIVGKNGEKILPLSSDNYYSPNQQSDNEVMEAKIFADPSGGVEYRNSSLLETKVLQLQESSINIGRIETNITIKDGKIIGDLKNSTSLDLVDCIILMSDGYYKIDSLKSGESYKLDGKAFVRYNGNIHQMIDDVFFQYNRRNSNMNDTERKKYMDRTQEGSILQMMLNNGNGQTEGVNFIAFSKTEIHNPLVINGKDAKKYERNVIYFPIELNFTDGDIIEYPFGFVPFDVLESSTLKYDTYSKIFYGNGSAEILYQLDRNMMVDEIKINAAKFNPKATIINISYNIFNIDQNIYEQLNTGIIKGEDLKKYLSQNNTVKIKVEVKDTEGTVPQMAAKGRKK